MTSGGGLRAATERLRTGLSAVRVRVLASVLLLTALAMGVAGTVSVLVQRAALVSRVDASLARDVKEFSALARQGPAAGQRFTGVEQLLRTAIGRQVPIEDQTYLGLVEGGPTLAPSTLRRPVQLEDEPAVMSVIDSLPADAPVRIRQAGTSVGDVRYAAVPVTIAGGTDRGYYVVATVLGPSQRVIREGLLQYALVATGSLVLVGLGGWLVAGRLLRPLRLLREAAERVSHTDLSTRIPVTGNDDISELTRTVNQMLDRLQAGFEAQQRFLDDAGHELKTPVTIVAGHLEVLDPHDPAEVAEVRDLALDELDRMGRLIRDLTLLAKSRRPDFVHPGPVDLVQLTDDVLTKAVALGPRRWTLDAHAETVVSADGQRLTQALLQLADNAVRHTADGDEIAIGSALERDQVRLWVRDTGPGVAPEDRERIFERFARARNAQGRTAEGSGLGLAIVTAIAEAHGGRVELDSTPGHGATFTLVLPGILQSPTRPQPSTTEEVRT
jgi:two-component system, OmpR family, sensor kinase